MCNIVKSFVAVFATLCMFGAVNAAPTIVSPVDYSTVDTIPEELKTFLWSDAMKDVKTFSYTAVGSDGNYVVPDSRVAYMADYRSNFKAVRLQWTGSGDHSGLYTVSIKRAKDNKEVLSIETNDTFIDFTAPENGRNYIWTVTDNTGTATGHFYTERYNGSRIINTGASDVSNLRDIGGWETTDGKVVKQGLIYRSASLEWTGINAEDTENAYFEIPYLRDTLGIRYEIDLREKSAVTELLGKSYWYGAGNLKESTIDPSIPRFFCEDVLGSSISFPSYEAIDSANCKKALWVTFTNFCDVVKSDGTVRPTLVHCSHGKDRTGVLVYTLLGVLGVPQDSLDREWALSWYAEGKYDVYMNTQSASKFTSASNRKWFLSDYTSDVNSRSGATLKEKCYNVLLECAKAVDSSDAYIAKAKTLIDSYVSVMLEEPEVAAENPNPPEDTDDPVVTVPTINPEWGYIKTGLGSLGNEVAVVFTNENATAMTWTVPETLENVNLLVVAGGASGGADIFPASGSSPFQGGGGGGGGGVVTGIVTRLAKDAVLTVSVGKGGAKRLCNDQNTNGAYGASEAGGNSSIKVDNTQIALAYGGGCDKGVTANSGNDRYTSGQAGGEGGSGGGGRPNKAGGAAKSGVVEESYFVCYNKDLGNAGGSGSTTLNYGYYFAAGGGGGALTAGTSGQLTDGNSIGGNGGEGLPSDITGTLLVYGSGGGGGSIQSDYLGGEGGSGAGDSCTAARQNYDGEDALANQGGGGGGGGRSGAGGAGGSGIVVLRYTTASVDPEEPVLTAVDAPEAVANLIYTGSELTGVVASEGYTLAGNTATDAGTYEATATLADGYKWSDDTTETKTIIWSIAKATNEWTTEPSISLTEWTQGEAAGVLTSGVAKFGTVTSSMTELPTTAGNYTITYTVAEDKNYTGLTKEVSFTINAAAVDPDQPGGGDDTDDPVVIVPTINPDWGYVKTGLGTGGDEVAVVFTNHLDKAMTWTIPQTLKNVQFLVVGGGGGGAAGTQGAGGGGGGVVTGKVYSLSKGSVVLAKVGVGGVPATANATGGKKGDDSSFSVDNLTYVTAYAGGAGRSNRDGGSGGGGLPGGAGGSATQGNVNEDIINLVYDIEKFGNKGGDGYKTSNSSVSGGGGGGALGVGGTPTGSTYGGTGGPGLPSDITGTLLTYGSGGGGSGSKGSSGGSGAGSGGNPASSGKANQGGGGGGGYGYAGDGGYGGSGIVVFRYGSANVSVDPSEPEEPVLTAVDAPVAVADLVYTGSELTGVVAADGYTLTGNTATDAGTYEATATLAEGYKWSDDTTELKTISWSIAKATNEWTTEPSISLETWTQGETAGVLTSGVAKFGEVTSSMAELPTAVGKYTITYTVVETDNYSGLTKEVSFEILKKPTSYDFTVGDVALTDGKLTFKGNFAIDGESEATEMNLVVSVYDVAEGGDALKMVTVEGVPAGEFNQEIDIAALELADGVYYLAFEVQDEAGNVLDKVEERSMLTIGEAKAVKPTVNYASGTKFTAIGVEQKPVVTPADGNGYTVSYEGDFTSAGTHRIVIALKDGWTWSDGTSDSLTYEYEFIERTYTEYYIKSRGGASDGGTYQSNDRWYTDPEFAAGSKMSTCPNVYDAHNIANIPSDSQCWLLIDNEEDIVVTPKFGKFTVDGNLRIVTYSGALMFQNDTATPMPIWEVKSGVSTIDGVVFDVNGTGTGYIDIAANATNVLGGVNYKSGLESSKKLFVRFSDEATAGSALRVHDFESYYATNLGWFEGGAEGSTYTLDFDEGALNLTNPDAVSGVAGDLAITVKLGDRVGAENAYLNVAGTLNINEGSTLAVDANSMPCGVYTIINAATFNGADLLTSAAGATVTGLAEFTSGELVREGNKIVLYIETTIPPRVPGIEGDSVATNAVFETARVAKPIWYKTMPAINGDEITFNRVTVKVPEYYDVTLETLADGYLVNLKLKDNLKAFIANKVENDQIVTPAIRIENEKVYIHLENTKSDLYYTLLKSTKLGAEAEWKPTEEYAIGKADFEYTPAEGEAETCFFKAGDVMDEPPAK